MSAKREAAPSSTGTAAVVTLKAEDVVKLQAALRQAAAALRELEGCIVVSAPRHAMRAEGMAEEYERAAEDIRLGRAKFLTVGGETNTPSEK